MPLGECTEAWGVSQAARNFLRSEGSQQQPWDLTPGRLISLVSLKTTGTYRKAVRYQGFTCEERVNAYYFQKHGRWNRLKLSRSLRDVPEPSQHLPCLQWPALPPLASAQLSTRANTTLWTDAHLGGESLLGHSTASEREKAATADTHRWWIGNYLRLWLVYWNWPSTYSACTRHPLQLAGFHAASHWGEGAIAKDSTLWMNSVSLDLILRTSAPAPWNLHLFLTREPWLQSIGEREAHI